MRYTQYRGLTQVANWVKLKFAAMNLKKLARWLWKDCFFLCLPLDLAHIYEKTGSRLMHVPVSRQAGTTRLATAVRTRCPPSTAL